ncbi:LysR substrate-binding domain-containing protein [Jannaschia rubra]|uniref:LysR substrate-binding domain-containing protein n=1 Tax=Jannaschia rubra TaxID=282197 RepID=UPI002492A92F|nr:LysR substrate-binding domain-containing protein [Jannaschia rubra]
MHPLRRSLPSLTALTAFEAAARYESFTRAAAALGVTQAAVSRRIKALEDEIGQPLFDRGNRRVRLTDAGRDLSAAVGRAFDDLTRTVDAIRRPGAKLTVAVSVAFGHFRLLPALSSFRATEPDIDLRVISEDAWNAPDDGQVDVAVRYGRPPFRGMRVAASLGEAVVPVCAPAMAADLGPVTMGGLARGGDIPLIDSASPEPSWLDWAGWFARKGWAGGFDGARLRFSSYSDAAYAAMDGQGVALGWTGLLERPLADGRLVALDVPPLRPAERHHILVPEGRPLAEPVDAFTDWLSGMSWPTG